MRSDPNGEGFLSAMLVSAVVGAAVNVVGQVISNVVAGNSVTDGVGRAALEGALSGATKAIKMNPVASFAVNAAISGVTSYCTQKRDGSHEVSAAQVCVDAVFGGLTGGRSSKQNGAYKALSTYGDRFMNQAKNAVRGGKTQELFSAGKRYATNIYYSFCKPTTIKDGSASAFMGLVVGVYNRFL